MTYDELKAVAKPQWDGYWVISAATARKISSTGKAPKRGWKVKANIMWPAQVCTVKGTREKVWCPEKEMWIGWTTYDGEQVLYVH